MDIKNKLTILVNSCDSYEDLWFPFFKLFDIYGSELKKCKIILNTEKKKFFFKYLKIECPNNYKKNIYWGQRIKTILKEIDTEYVLFLLDDFFLREPVDIKAIKQCISWLDENNRVGCFNFIPIETANIESDKFKSFCEMPLGMEYRCNAQAAIWRKDILNASLLSIESPWEWETYGNIRNRTILKEVEFYSLKHNVPFIIDYGKKDGLNWGVVRGKWFIGDVRQVFDRYDINIDYSIRGIYTSNKNEKITTQNSAADKKSLDNPKKHSKFYSLIAEITRPIRKPFIKFFDRKKEQKLSRNQRKERKILCYVIKPIERYLNNKKNWDTFDYLRKVK